MPTTRPKKARVTRRELEREMAAFADKTRAKNLAWFFKTGPGQYGEGDRFLGIRVPVQRQLAHKYISLSLTDIEHLLASPFHEHRFTALEILVAQYELASASLRKELCRFYVANAKKINNWDLVDTSAPYILGEELKGASREVLHDLASSENVWERRIAIVATLAFVKAGQIDDTFALAKLLLGDKHDLIHKAVGWALREAGRVSRPRLLAFLKENYSGLPRTTFRYAIEHWPPEQRKLMLGGIFS